MTVETNRNSPSSFVCETSNNLLLVIYTRTHGVATGGRESGTRTATSTSELPRTGRIVRRKKFADTLKGPTTKHLTCSPSMVRPMITWLSRLELASWRVMSWNSTNLQRLLQDDVAAEWKKLCLRMTMIYTPSRLTERANMREVRTEVAELHSNRPSLRWLVGWPMSGSRPNPPTHQPENNPAFQG